VWTNISFTTSGAPPVTVGDLIPGGQPFNVVVVPSGVWGATPTGRLAVPNLQAAAYAGVSLNSFVQGAWQPTLRVPFALNAWFTNGARVVIHLNSVSVSAAMAVLVDGAQLCSTNLPNLDGLNEVNNEYNLDVPLNLPAGNHLIEITNPALGWVYLDWVRLEQVLPATYPGHWQPTPDAIGLRGSHESLLYVVAPWVSFSGSSTNAVLPLQQGQTVKLTNWPAGPFVAEWFDPLSAAFLGLTEAVTTNGTLRLPLPDFSEDLAGIVYPPPALTPLGRDQTGAFQFRLDSETGGRYLIQTSSDLSTWTTYRTVTNETGALPLFDPSAATNSRAFFRAKQNR
jgi:hypothetical protein